jgi:hypothetical protein
MVSLLPTFARAVWLDSFCRESVENRISHHPHPGRVHFSPPRRACVCALQTAAPQHGQKRDKKIEGRKWQGKSASPRLFCKKFLTSFPQNVLWCF